MSIDIQPSELSFRRPFTVEVEQVLTIKNNGSTPLAFKVKTTAPKQYCVRPNAGRIEPGQDFDVTVILQAMKADPPLDSRCRDKFLVQSAPISADKDFSNIASILDSTDKSILQERKIRVNWLAAQGSDYDSAAVPSVASLTPSKHAINGASDTPDASRTFSSPAADAGPPPYSDEPSTHETPRSAIASGTSLFQNESKGSKADADLSSAKDTGLRRRDVKTSAPSEKASRGQVAQAVKGPEGVPVQVVAMLCLLSFLLAYFFF